MTHRLAQPGTGARRDLVLVYHFVDDKGLIPTSLGPDTCIVHIDKAPWEVHDGLPRIAESVRWAEQRESFRTNRVIASGWSIGCKGLRSQLASGSRPDAIVAADGMHSTWPVNAGHIELWREYAAEHPLLASDCGHVYMRKLAAGKRYSAVVDVLRGVTGATIDELDRGPEDRPGRLDVGNVRLWLTTGGLKGPNGPAHIAHATKILPVMLREALRVTEAPADTEPAPPPPPSTDRPLRLRALDWCLREAERWGDAPVPVSRIDEYMAGCERGGKKLGLGRGQQWNFCAASQGCAEHETAVEGELIPPWRAGAKEIMRDAQQGNRGAWHDVEECRRGEWYPPPGALCVYHRGPPGDWRGHVDRCVDVDRDAGTYRNVGGNERGGRWVVESSRFDNPALLGFLVDDEEWRPTQPIVAPDPPEGEAEPPITDTDRRQLLGQIALTTDGQVRELRRDGYGR